ncbi:2-oxoglutarate ferredoxin oxidoreductase subunit beta [Caldalkalibacillus uzonensis]|uniref:2-oxoglutarate ferredoxin oxidoreductase subunit beta n=1 Tax=Caldalkalibacillus uzonensis TaxID=353224 RepID=A0ABU0CVQ2_9BACI|nr:thiamine pyrophosphate-dependent enzyme [Caldalkalibacillus uzonensis]MDQ0339961.1 2-oxoglutarate ferredoxin oxidoreductase subunit beta [Caldalkalibacillus uzonensis]
MSTTLTAKDYSNGNKPTWCPGCGDYSVLRGIQKALLSLGIRPEKTVLVSGIGCSGKIAHYFGGYAIHVTHGRTLPTAQGIKTARPDLTVIAAGGDGDGYGIGVGHLVHAARRNLPITYIVMDNSVYGNTKGQTSPTSPLGYQSSTSPMGNQDMPVNPLLLAWSAGASFIGQGFSGDYKHLEDLFKRGIQHQGFSLINVFSPCVVFNKAQGYDYYKNNIVYQDHPAPSAEEYISNLMQSPKRVGVLWEKEIKERNLRNQPVYQTHQEVISYLRTNLA